MDNHNQSVIGNENQVAGRDIINNGSTIGRPKPDNPNMMSCPVCHDYWVSKDAD